jgi:hypothetical protein
VNRSQVCRNLSKSLEPNVPRSQDLLEGEEVVADFSVAVAELFEEWDF